MTLFTLVLENIWAKKARSTGIAFAVALSVMTVVTLTVVSSGLENAAAAVLTIGKADFTVAQTILAFKNDKTYYQVALLRQGQPIDVPGFFLPGDDQDFIVLNLFEDEPWRAVAHDFA